MSIMRLDLADPICQKSIWNFAKKLEECTDLICNYSEN